MGPAPRPSRTVTFLVLFVLFISHIRADMTIVVRLFQNSLGKIRKINVKSCADLFMTYFIYNKINVNIAILVLQITCKNILQTVMPGKYNTFNV